MRLKLYKQNTKRARFQTQTTFEKITFERMLVYEIDASKILGWMIPLANASWRKRKTKPILSRPRGERWSVSWSLSLNRQSANNAATAPMRYHALLRSDADAKNDIGMPCEKSRQHSWESFGDTTTSENGWYSAPSAIIAPLLFIAWHVARTLTNAIPSARESNPTILIVDDIGNEVRLVYHLESWNSKYPWFIGSLWA